MCIRDSHTGLTDTASDGIGAGLGAIDVGSCRNGVLVNVTIGTLGFTGGFRIPEERQSRAVRFTPCVRNPFHAAAYRAIVGVLLSGAVTFGNNLGGAEEIIRITHPRYHADKGERKEVRAIRQFRAEVSERRDWTVAVNECWTSNIAHVPLHLIP